MAINSGEGHRRYADRNGKIPLNPDRAGMDSGFGEYDFDLATILRTWYSTAPRTSSAYRSLSDNQPQSVNQGILDGRDSSGVVLNLVNRRCGSRV